MDLLAKVNQTLSGRTALLKLLPFSIEELESKKLSYQIDEYLLNGFYPRIYDKKLNPTKTYKDYFEIYIQRDLRKLINIKDLRLFRKFVRLCAGRIGQVFSTSSLSNEVGVSTPTINSWISILEASYVIFLLEPYYENIGKRLIKSPKLYFVDVGLASYLLGIENGVQLERDPLHGALVENLVIGELIKERFNLGLDQNLYFYRDNHGNEIDALFKAGHELVPFEIKSAQTFNRGFLKQLEYMAKIFPAKIKKGYLVYTGAVEQKMDKFLLLNYKNVYKTI